MSIKNLYCATFAGLSVFMISHSAYGWSAHNHLMQFILKGLHGPILTELHQRHSKPCIEEDKEILDGLQYKLKLNLEKGFHFPMDEGPCHSNETLSGYDVLGGND